MVNRLSKQLVDILYYETWKKDARTKLDGKYGSKKYGVQDLEASCEREVCSSSISFRAHLVGSFGNNGKTLWRPLKYEHRIAVAN